MSLHCCASTVVGELGSWFLYWLLIKFGESPHTATAATTYVGMQHFKLIVALMIKLNTAALNEIMIHLQLNWNTQTSYIQDTIFGIPTKKNIYLVALQQQKASFYNVAAGCS